MEMVIMVRSKTHLEGRAERICGRSGCSPDGEVEEREW
jgi:hypothetical protein